MASDVGAVEEVWGIVYDTGEPMSEKVIYTPTMIVGSFSGGER